MHLSELNIAKPKFANDDPRFAGFIDNLNRINELGFTMPGFVWFHMDESGHAMDIETPWPGAAANMSVWETPEHLEHFVWNTVHRQFYERRQEWFEVLGDMHFVMWWVPAGHHPTLDEALGRLEHLKTHGPSDHAFGWDHLPAARLHRTRACGSVAAE